MLMELQLHLRPIHDLKSKVGASKNATGQTGHQRYILFRNIKENAEYVSKLVD